MTPPTGSASYKKRDGTLTLSGDSKSVIWTPLGVPGGPPTLKLAVSSVTSRYVNPDEVNRAENADCSLPDLQQTPASSAKVMLKIFTQCPGALAPETHVFSFISAVSARVEADAIKDALSVAIHAIKGAAGIAAESAERGSARTFKSLAINNALSAATDDRSRLNGWYDDARLRSDIELQKSLLKSDPSLQKTFMESLRTKPDSISNARFTDQFWSTRISLLRGHAIEKNQSRGPYNVLSTIKSRTEDNVTRLSISKEQIQLIFNQHPLVKRMYDENVPQINESEFWSKFFQSRVFKMLKGEKIVETDALVPIMDRYLREGDDSNRTRRLLNVEIPHIIDIEGNEQNHSQRKGNQPDLTMRPASSDNVPIIRTLNTLSERIMADVVPIDTHPTPSSATADDETFRELALHDLEDDADEDRIMFRVKDQPRFFSRDQEMPDADDPDSGLASDPATVLQAIRMDLRRSIDGSDGLDLEHTIGIDEASDTDTDDDVDNEMRTKQAHVGSRASLAQAKKQMMVAMTQRQAQVDDILGSSSPTSTMAMATSLDMTSGLFERVTLTHATTTEFLHHFWTAFLSGDASRAHEVAGLVESLRRALGRMEAVMTDADEDRLRQIERRKKDVKELYLATGRKVRFHPDSVRGGSETVQNLLAPTVQAVTHALAQYERALVDPSTA